MFYTLNIDLDDAHMDIIMCMCKLDHDVEVNRPRPRLNLHQPMQSTCRFALGY